MKKLFKEKRAEERYMSPWLFLVWALIGVAIVGAVLIFYSAEADVREQESKILASRILDCISDNNYLKTEFLLKDYDIFKECNFNKEILDESREFYFSVSAIGTGISKKIIYGEKDFEIQCELEGKNFAKCSRKRAFLLDSNDNKITLEIFAGSNQQGRKI
tara:strand:- start:58 stop:540 length:483 start_codon:yes stop_codon:yes gene_type:complete